MNQASYSVVAFVARYDLPFPPPCPLPPRPLAHNNTIRYGAVHSTRANCVESVVRNGSADFCFMRCTATGRHGLCTKNVYAANMRQLLRHRHLPSTKVYTPEVSVCYRGDELCIKSTQLYHTHARSLHVRCSA